MSFNIEQTLSSMLDAAAAELSDSWPAIQDCVERALQDEKTALAEIMAAFEAGDLSDEDLQTQLTDEKLAIESALLACRVRSKVMAQNAANAAIEALTSAIKLAI